MLNTNLIANHVGYRIRQIREQKNISLLSLSYICKIEYSHLCKIEFGKLNTSLENLIKIANALDVNIIYFFTNNNLDCNEIKKNYIFKEEFFLEIHTLGKLIE